MLPLNLYIYVQLASDRRVRIDWSEVILAVAVVLAGVLAGLGVGMRKPHWRGAVNKAGSVAGVALMVLSLFANTQSHDPIWTKPVDFFAACTLPCLAGLCATFGISRLLRLPFPESTTVAIECVYQNTSLALAIALSAFPSSEAGAAAGVPLVYGCAEIGFIALFGLCSWQLGWTYAPRREGLCTVLVHNYQPNASAEQGASEAATAACLSEARRPSGSLLAASCSLFSRSMFLPSAARDPSIHAGLSAPLAPGDVLQDPRAAPSEEIAAAACEHT